MINEISLGLFEILVAMGFKLLVLLLKLNKALL